MASFFEKLKKGMGIEEVIEETEEVEKFAEASSHLSERSERREMNEVQRTTPSSSLTRSAIEERPARKKKVPKVKKVEIEVKLPEIKVEKIEVEKPEMKEEEVPVEKTEEKKEKWPEPEGQLTIDVYQTENSLVIQSAIAGVKPEDLDISLEKDILAIKGSRQKPFEENGDYFTQECYWGHFSREVILPVEVDPNQSEATMKDGILTIIIPKLFREKLRRIKVRI